MLFFIGLSSIEKDIHSILGVVVMLNVKEGGSCLQLPQNSVWLMLVAWSFPIEKSWYVALVAIFVLFMINKIH